MILGIYMFQVAPWGLEEAFRRNPGLRSGLQVPPDPGVQAAVAEARELPRLPVAQVWK